MSASKQPQSHSRHVAAHHPGPDDEMLRAAVGERSYARGWAYFLGGALGDLRRTSRGARGRCEGSTDGPYTVRAGFGDNDGFAAECSCPVGSEGRCKHAAALLLAWRHAPDEFLSVPDVDAALAHLESADELRVVLRALRRRHPEIEGSLEELLARPSTKAPSPSARRAVAAAFRRHGGVPEAIAPLSDDLWALSRGADARALRGELDEAAEVYRAVAYGVALRSARCADDLGALRAVAAACLEKLAACAAAMPAGADREGWRATFRDLAALDAEHDGPGFGDAAVRALGRRGAVEDRRSAGAWLRAKMERAEGYTKRAYLVLRTSLGPDGCASLDEFAALCREANKPRELCEALLRAGSEREGEAKRVLSELSDDVLLGLAQTEGLGESALLRAALEGRAEGARPGVRLLAWLRAERARRGDARGALEVQARAVTLRPEEGAWLALRDEARAQGVWERVRGEVLEAIATRAGPLAVEWWLAEGCMEEALVEAERGRFEGAPGARALAHLADEAERAGHERAAARVFQRASERWIDARGRASYREAASCALRAKRAMEPGAWSAWVGRVRDEALEGARKSAALGEEWERVTGAMRAGETAT